MRKTALTACGRIGTDWVRMTAAYLESGSAVFVRADGSNAIVPIMPTAFRTSGDIANVAATSGKRVNFSAVPNKDIAAHTWKKEHDLTSIALHFGCKVELVAALQSSYASVDSIAA